MSSFELNGIKISFPYEPYEIQKDYMKKVIESLQNSTHAVLESPTGTGKTLSLLCSSLAWLMTEKIKYAATNRTADSLFNNPEWDNIENVLKNQQTSWAPPKIIYSSRTHSQLSQAMQELKNTIYKDCIKASIIGSRDQMCLKKDVLEQKTNMMQVNLCRALIKSHQCSLYYGVQQKRDAIISSANVLDIEDLVKAGRKQHFCPYYMAREIKQQADIIFMPYNYLLDSSSRKNFGVDLLNTVIILDEAHNVEKICEESASVQITSTDIAMAIEELTHVMRAMEKEEYNVFSGDVPKDFTLDDLAILKSAFLEFEKVVNAIKLNNLDGETYDGQYLHQLLEESQINCTNRQYIVNIVDKLVQYLTTTQTEAFSRNGQFLLKMKELLVLLHEYDTDMLRDKVKKCFRVHIVEEELTKGKQNKGWQNKSKIKTQKVINYWCFSPGFGMETLIRQGVRNIILTSGTLAPLQPLISELGLDVPVRLENPHIISKSQILVKIVCNGHRNVLLDSSYKNRNNSDYMDSLGKTIKAFANMIPDGLLVFFPSYPNLHACSEHWQNTGIWSDICKTKPIFVEPRNKDDFNNVMTEYYNQIKLPKSRGACFFAVCRGKVSEGLDFADENGRGVIITGLPFPPLKEPRIILKRKYLDILSTRENQIANGQKWYTLEAIRAVNQAIGRVIRHKNDYGVILLCDNRFDNPSLRNDLSAWLRGHIQKTNTFPQAIAGVSKFFHEAQKQFPTNKTKQIEEENNENGSTSSSSNFFISSEINKPGTFSQIKKQFTGESTESILAEYKQSTSDLTENETNIRKNSGSILGNLDKGQTVQIPLQRQYFDAVSKTSQSSHDSNTNSKCTESNTTTTTTTTTTNFPKRRKITIISNQDRTTTDGENDKPTNSHTKAINMVAKINKYFPEDKRKIITEGILQYKKNYDVFSFIKCIHDFLGNCTNSIEYLYDLLGFIKSKSSKRIFEQYINLRRKWDFLNVEERKSRKYDEFLLTKENVDSEILNDSTESSNSNSPTKSTSANIELRNDIHEHKNALAKNVVLKLRANLPREKLDIFLEGVTTYKKDKNIYQFIKCIHTVLADITNSRDYLQDLRTCLKSLDHKDIFETYTDLRSRWDLLSPEERLHCNYGDYLLCS